MSNEGNKFTVWGSMIATVCCALRAMHAWHRKRCDEQMTVAFWKGLRTTVLNVALGLRQAVLEIIILIRAPTIAGLPRT